MMNKLKALWNKPYTIGLSCILTVIGLACYVVAYGVWVIWNNWDRITEKLEKTFRPKVVKEFDED